MLRHVSCISPSPIAYTLLEMGFNPSEPNSFGVKTTVARGCRAYMRLMPGKGHDLTRVWRKGDEVWALVCDGHGPEVTQDKKTDIHRLVTHIATAIPQWVLPVDCESDEAISSFFTAHFESLNADLKSRDYVASSGSTVALVVLRPKGAGLQHITVTLGDSPVLEIETNYTLRILHEFHNGFAADKCFTDGSDTRRSRDMRFGAGLNISRSLGDSDGKYVLCTPTVSVKRYETSVGWPAFVGLASDGILCKGAFYAKVPHYPLQLHSLDFSAGSSSDDDDLVVLISPVETRRLPAVSRIGEWDKETAEDVLQRAFAHVRDCNDLAGVVRVLAGGQRQHDDEVFLLLNVQKLLENHVLTPENQ